MLRGNFVSAGKSPSRALSPQESVVGICGRSIATTAASHHPALLRTQSEERMRGGHMAGSKVARTPAELSDLGSAALLNGPSEFAKFTESEKCGWYCAFDYGRYLPVSKPRKPWCSGHLPDLRGSRRKENHAQGRSQVILGGGDAGRVTILQSVRACGLARNGIFCCDL